MKTFTKILPKSTTLEATYRSVNVSKKNILANKTRTISKAPSTKNDYNPSNSWDFTPFPILYFSNEKKAALNDINNLNFKSKKECLSPINKIDNLNQPKSFLNKSNSYANLFLERNGDIRKYRSPAFSFGASREDCKLPSFIKEKISPSPGSYNLRPLFGLGGNSKKYSINKCTFLKNYKSFCIPGPGKYNINNCDSKNNGNIILSNFKNSPISNFGKYKEERIKYTSGHSDWNIRPEPASYNINKSISMFTGTGKFPLSNFRSNISKSINKCNSLHEKINAISPGPGSYNHHSTFLGYKF